MDNNIRHYDVCYYAKIRILKQITTNIECTFFYFIRCLLLCKDKNFKANYRFND